MEHRIIPGLRVLLEAMEDWAEVQTIIPAKISPCRSSRPLCLRVQYKTHSGIKCIALSKCCVQEVFIATNQPVRLRARIDAQFPLAAALKEAA